MKQPVPTSLGLSTLFNFYKKHKIPLNELERFEDQFEQTGGTKEAPLWSAKIGRAEEEIVHFNLAIMGWVWGFRDFFWVFAVKTLGMKEEDAKKAVKAVVASSDAMKLCGYFRNVDEHVELKDFKNYPGFETKPPKLGEVRIQHLAENGDTAYATNFIGADWAAVSDQLPFVQTVMIENFPGERDTRRIAEEAAWEWIKLLKDNGHDLGVTKPQWFLSKPVIERIVFGATPKAKAANRWHLPQGFIGPTLEFGCPLDYEQTIVGPFQLDKQ